MKRKSCVVVFHIRYLCGFGYAFFCVGEAQGPCNLVQKFFKFLSKFPTFLQERLEISLYTRKL